MVTKSEDTTREAVVGGIMMGCVCTCACVMYVPHCHRSEGCFLGEEDLREIA